MKLILLLQVMNHSDFPRKTKSSFSWKSHQQSSWSKNWRMFRNCVWMNFREEDRKSGHYEWTHGQKERKYRMKSIAWVSRDFEDTESVRSGPSRVLMTISWSSGITQPQHTAPRYFYIRKPFLQIDHRLLRHFVQEDSILGFLKKTENTLWFTSTKRPVTCGQRQFPDSEISVRTVSRKFILLQGPSLTKLWITKVKMVQSVDDPKSLCSVRGIRMPDVEDFDGRFASALDKIIQNTRFKRKVVWRNKKPKKRTVSFKGNRSLIWSMSPSGSLESMILSRTMPTYLLLVFEMMIFRHSIQSGTEFYCPWRKSRLNGILEGLYNLRIRESEKLKTVLVLYDLEIQKKLGPDYHRFKTMVKRSIEQEIRNKNFGARSGNFEKNAVVKNQGTKQRVQRILGDCWQWEANGQCVKGDNCSFRHDINKRGKSYTIKFVSEFFHAAEWAKIIEDPKSQRKKSQW